MIKVIVTGLAMILTSVSLAGAQPLEVVINEVDADQVSTDAAEFVELYDGGVGNTPLTGLTLVFYNGSDDLSYLAFDLDGQSTDGDGYFVICGTAANVANCDLDVSPDVNLLQNGADAVALVVGDAVWYFNDSALPNTGDILDAIVYDTNDSDDAGLLVLLNAGQPQVNEGGAGNQTGHSNQRCPNGSGGARNTDSYFQAVPTPGVANECPSTVSAPTPVVPEAFALHQNVPNPFNPATTIRYDVAHGGEHVTLQIFDVSGRLVRTLVDGHESEGQKSAMWDGRNTEGQPVVTGVYFYRLTADRFQQTRKMVLLK